MKEAWQYLKEYWPRIILFLGLYLILGLGAYQLLFFVSDVGGDEMSPRAYLSFLAGLGLTALGFHVYFKQKEDLKLLKDALRVLAYLDPKGFYHPKGLGFWCGGEYMPRLRDNSLDEFDPNKDIALGLILEADGVLAKFSDSDKGIVGDWDLNDNRGKIAKIVVKLNKREWLFTRLTILNELILDNIENWIKQHFPKEVYFLRLNLLNYFIQASDQVKFLVFDKPKGLSSEKILFVETKEGSLDCKDNIVKEFFKVVLNKYYSKFQDYEMQPVNFDHRLFRKCFTVEGAVWGFLREAYWLLWNAYEYDGHRKNPPAIGELLSNVYQIYENKELSNANVSVVLWNAYEALSNANKIYEVNVKELPTSARFDLDFEIYAKKELSSGAGELMLPYLEEAEKFLIEAENLLRFSEVEHWEFCDSPIPIVKN